MIDDYIDLSIYIVSLLYSLLFTQVLAFILAGWRHCIDIIKFIRVQYYICTSSGRGLNHFLKVDVGVWSEF